ncbi:hypothetical protein [Nonomuraea roseola]|uniref:Carboxymuconolactone decarboxylase family protein n=1 Tax=Nonomuraea roseola TaxID=46179 RepID=A0ABV5Q4Q2_9ACTN
MIEKPTANPAGRGRGEAELRGQVADHYEEIQLVALILLISLTNLCNRLTATIQEPAGTSRRRPARRRKP